MAQVTDTHGQFLTSTMVAQLCIGAFTQSIWVCGTLELIVMTMIFSGPFVPTPITRDLVLELNLYFPLAALASGLAGVLLAKALGISVILETTIGWRHARNAYGLATWCRSLFSLLLVSAVSTAIYDYSISAWYPGRNVMYSVGDALVIQALACACAYWVLRSNSGRNQPFMSGSCVRRFMCGLFVGIALIYLVMGYSTEQSRKAVDMKYAAGGVSAFICVVSWIVIESCRWVIPSETWHTVRYYYMKCLMHETTAIAVCDYLSKKTMKH